MGFTERIARPDGVGFKSTVSLGEGAARRGPADRGVVSARRIARAEVHLPPVMTATTINAETAETAEHAEQSLLCEFCEFRVFRVERRGQRLPATSTSRC